MGEQAFEEMVRRALLEANRQEWAEVTARAEEAEPEFSPRYLKRRLKLVNAPFPYAKRKARPAWKRALRTAACFLLAFALSFGILMASVPEVRAWVEDVFVQWFYDHTGFRFGGGTKSSEVSDKLRPTYLPEGVCLIEEDVLGYVVQVIYEEQDGARIYFNYTATKSSNVFGVDNEHQGYTETTVNGETAYLLEADEEGYKSFLIWVDEDKGISFRITSGLSGKEMIKMAESIK